MVELAEHGAKKNRVCIYELTGVAMRIMFRSYVIHLVSTTALGAAIDGAMSGNLIYFH